MKGIFVLCKKGILNNKGRTIMAISSIAIAVTIMVSLNISINSIKSNIINTFNEKSLGADIIVKTGSTNLTEDTIKKIDDDDNVKQVFLRVNTFALYRNNDSDSWLQMIGIDVIKEKDASTIKFLKGNLPVDNEVLVSSKFADNKKVEIGESLDLRTDSGNISVKISGILDDYGLVKENNGNVIIMKSSIVQELINTTNYSTANISLNDGVDVLEERNIIQNKLGDGISVFLPRDKSEDTIKTLDSLFIGFNLFGALAFVLGLFIINNTMKTIVLNSSNEIAIMKVFGYTKKEVFKWIVLQSLIYGVIGSLIGVVLGFVLSNSMTALINMMVVSLNVVQIQVPWFKVISLGMIGILVSLIAGIIPAERAANVTVVEGLSVGKLSRRSDYRRIIILLFISIALLVFFIIVSYFKLLSKSQYFVFAFVVISIYLLLFLLIKPIVRCIYRIVGFLNPINSQINAINMTSNISRTVNTITSIVICVSMAVGLSGVISSFKLSLLDETKSIYSEDILVTADFGIKEDDIKKHKETNGVEKISSTGFKPVLSEKKDVFLYGVDFSQSEMKLTGGDDLEIKEGLEKENTIAISKRKDFFS